MHPFYLLLLTLSSVSVAVSYTIGSKLQQHKFIMLDQKPFSCGARAIIDVLVLLLLLLSFVTIHSHYISNFPRSRSLSLATWMLADVYISEDLLCFVFAGHSLRPLVYTFQTRKKATNTRQQHQHSTNVLFSDSILFLLSFGLFYISFPIVSSSKLPRTDLASLFYTLHH